MSTGGRQGGKLKFLQVYLNRTSTAQILIEQILREEEIAEPNKKIVRRSDGLVDKRSDTANKINNKELKVERYGENLGFTWM